MPYLVHTSHSQLAALPVGFMGWALTLTALGVIQWRVWLVDDLRYITSGVAWVGVWRACFVSHTLVSPELRVMYCRGVGLWDAFAPPELKAAQVLMLAAAALGLAGNAFAVYGLRNVHLGLGGGKGRGAVPKTLFSVAGGLLLSSAAASLTPLAWNAYAVARNHTVHFPPDFHMPAAPRSQAVGAGVLVGIIASVLTLTSGVVYLNYRPPKRSGGQGSGEEPGEVPAASSFSGSGDKSMNNNRRVTLVMSDREGMDNLGFESV